MTTTATAKTPAQIRASLPRVATPRLPHSVSDAPAAIAKPAREYEDLRQRAVAAVAQAVELEASRIEREKADRAAHVVALRAGKDDPGSPNVDALEAELPGVQREAAALVSAVHEAWSELKEALNEHLPAWREQLHNRRAKLAAVTDQHLDAVDRAVNDVAAVNSTLVYVENARRSIEGNRRFPNGEQGGSANVNIGGALLGIANVLASIRSVFAGGSES